MEWADITALPLLVAQMSERQRQGTSGGLVGLHHAIASGVIGLPSPWLILSGAVTKRNSRVPSRASILQVEELHEVAAGPQVKLSG
jgi:hypothetical protein